MKNMKKLITLGAMVASISIMGVTAFATTTTAKQEDVVTTISAADMTPEEIQAYIENYRANCDQTGSAQICRELGLCQGNQGQGHCQNQDGTGQGMRSGNGMGRRGCRR